MQCRQCGAQFADGTKFCPECGAMQPVSGQPAQQVYPQPQGNYARPRKKSVALPLLIVCAVVTAAILLFLIFLPKLFGFMPADGPTEETGIVREDNPTSENAPAAQNGEQRYRPGNYVKQISGDHILRKEPGSDDYAEVDFVENGAAVVITEIREIENAESAFDRWWGKTAVGGETGWVRLYEYTCTDLIEAEADAARERRLWNTLRGVWNAEIRDSVIFFTEEGPDGKNVKFGPRDSEADFFGLVKEPFFGGDGSLIRITACSPGTEDFDGVERAETEIFLYVDVSAIDDGKIVWSVDMADWTVAYFVTADLNEYMNLPPQEY